MNELLSIYNQDSGERLRVIIYDNGEVRIRVDDVLNNLLLKVRRVGTLERRCNI